MDWHTRTVLAWRISNTLEADFCVEALNNAIARFGLSDTMNTDQGRQFMSFAWIDWLRRSGVRISMDGKGLFLNNVFVGRLWRSLKYGCVYLRAWETRSEARAGISRWIGFHNRRRPHSALGGKPPAVVYWQRNDQQMQKVALFYQHPSYSNRISVPWVCLGHSDKTHLLKTFRPDLETRRDHQRSSLSDHH